MSSLRYLLLPLIACPVLFLTGALERPPAPVAAAAPLAEDPAASQLFGRAVALVQPDRLPWLAATVWQQVVGDDMTYQAEGRYQSGPGQRLHLNLEVHLGRSRGELQVISDGTARWEVMQINGEPRTVCRKKGEANQDAPLPNPATAVLPRPAGSGLAPLLAGLRARMTATSQEAYTWKGRDVTRISLVWSPAAERALVPAGQAWPAFVPRKCFVFLDDATLWPHRLEWWGPRKAGAARDQALVQMEWRDPVRNQPLSAEQCARDFTFTPAPGDFTMPDQEIPEPAEAGTAQVSESLKVAAPRPARSR